MAGVLVRRAFQPASGFAYGPVWRHGPRPSRPACRRLSTVRGSQSPSHADSYCRSRPRRTRRGDEGETDLQEARHLRLWSAPRSDLHHGQVERPWRRGADIEPRARPCAIGLWPGRVLPTSRPSCRPLLGSRAISMKRRSKAWHRCYPNSSPATPFCSMAKCPTAVPRTTAAGRGVPTSSATCLLVTRMRDATTTPGGSPNRVANEKGVTPAHSTSASAGLPVSARTLQFARHRHGLFERARPHEPRRRDHFDPWDREGERRECGRYRHPARRDDVLTDVRTHSPAALRGRVS